jgi:hypothetical protein
MAIEVKSQLALGAAIALNQDAPTGLVLEPLGTAPTSPHQGRTYFDTTLIVPRVWDGTQWLDLFHINPSWGNVTAQTSFGASSANGSSTNFARADHTHGTPAHNDAAHSAIHLSALAAPTAAVNCGAQRFTNAADPVNDQDLATKAFVTVNSYGLDPHASVDLVLTNETLFGASPPSGEMQIDGILTANSRVLVAQPHPSGDPSTLYNGIWITSSGTWTRATDADGSGEIRQGTVVYVSGGKQHKGELWSCYGTSDTPWDSTAASYWTTLMSLSTTLAGTGLRRVGNRLDTAPGGVGIDLSSGLVSVDVSVVSRKIKAVIGNGAATSFNIDCSAIGGAYGVIAQAWDVTTGHAAIVDFSGGTTAGGVNITATFDDPPSADSVLVVIHG